MSRITAFAWRCDRPECGWTWLALSDKAPKVCSKCKCRNWNGGVAQRIERLDPKKTIAGSIPALTANETIYVRDDYSQ